jgi:ketosteroid isomerase-like protein
MLPETAQRGSKLKVPALSRDGVDSRYEYLDPLSLPLDNIAARKGESIMTRIAVSRRKVLETGACALAGVAAFPVTASAHARTGSSTRTEEIIRKWYKEWEEEKKDWGPFDARLADNFTFSSAAGDDHISKSTFKTQCWDTQINFIDRFDLERVFVSGNEALVKYLCYTKNGKSLRNVEYLRLRDGKIESIECYFGGKDTFPSAVSGSGM